MMKVNQATTTPPRFNPVQLPLARNYVSINVPTRIFFNCAMMTGMSSIRSCLIVIYLLIPRA
jgi:hypothetical protein